MHQLFCTTVLLLDSGRFWGLTGLRPSWCTNIGYCTYRCQTTGRYLMKLRGHSQAMKSGGQQKPGQRKIIVYVATSADGYIARPDGGVDWLNRPMPKGSYGMTAFTRSIDTILWGRKTYDFAAKMGGAGAYGKVKHYVFSRHPPSDPLPEFVFVSESIPEFVGKLQAVPGKNIWMMGGAEIIASFLDEGVIDEFSIHVIPVMIGEGIPLVAPRHRNIELELISARSFPDGVVHLNYSVQR